MDAMDTKELEERVRLGEDSRTEWKEESAQPDALAAAIVALTNTSGGLMVLGISDKGEVKGVSDPDGAMQRIDHICRQNIEPPFVHASIEKHLVEGKILLAIHIPRGPQRPYRTNRGTYYVRGAAGRRIATRQELLELFQAARDLHPDELAVEDAGLDDLDIEKIRSIREGTRILSSEEMKRSLISGHFMADDVHPTLGGILCFGRDPQRFRPYARLTAILHKGTAVTEEFIDRLEIGGPVHDQIAEARDFIRRSINPGKQRPVYPIPFEAVDEALVNAVAHRDYLALSQARLFIFDDRIEVINPGRLLNTVTIDAIRQGYHLVRNPVIFSHLSRLGLATDAGRGVPSMISLWRAAGLGEPEFSVLGAEFRVTFRLTG